MRHVVLVSPHFPPSMLAGAHRARHLAKHLPAAGWRPTVLCVDERFYEETIDPELATLLPQDLAIVKSRALPARVMGLVGIGDIGLRAYFSLKAALQHLLQTDPADAVLITGFPCYPMLLSRWLKQQFGQRVVLDFQDPWVSEYGKSRPALSKDGLSHWLASRLEPRALRYADFVTSVSEIQNAEMAQRYPWLSAERMAAVPIGGDPDDYTHLRRRPRRNAQHILDPGCINFSYVGTFLPRSGPTAQALFAALAHLRQQKPDLAKRLRFKFVGSSNQPDLTTAYRFRPLAEAAGVGDLVAETPQRVPYLEALNILANSDAVLLLGSDETHYTASKIYPGLMSDRPFLSLFHRSSSAHRILADAGGGYALSFTTGKELDGLRGEIASAIDRLASAPEALGKPRRDAIAPYEASATARRFAGILDTVIR